MRAKWKLRRVQRLRARFWNPPHDFIHLELELWDLDKKRRVLSVSTGYRRLTPAKAHVTVWAPTGFRVFTSCRSCHLMEVARREFALLGCRPVRNTWAAVRLAERHIAAFIAEDRPNTTT